MNIWRKFKKKGEAMPNLMRRGCWMKCWKCDEDWSRIKTMWIHMVIFREGGKQESRFICDDCEKDF